MKKTILVLAFISLLLTATALSLSLTDSVEKPLPKEEETKLRELFDKPEAEVKKFDSNVSIGKNVFQTESFSVDGEMFNRIDVSSLSSVKEIKEVK